jgi:large subunit ribosomal protein L23
MKNVCDILKKPCLTEKAMLLQERTNQVVLKVDPRANKIEIKEAAEKLFNLKITKVRTANMHGKTKRVGKHMGTTNDWKKAIVSLHEGQKMDFLEQL